MSFDEGFKYGLMGAGIVVLISLGQFIGVHYIKPKPNTPKPSRGLIVGTVVLWGILVCCGLIAVDILGAHSKGMAAYEGATGSIILGIIANYAVKDGPFASFLPRQE